MKTVLTTNGAAQTKQLGRQIGSKLKGGETIELVSDLGGGKTTLVHGLAEGIASSDKVASPTFTVSRVYKGEALEMHHFDFYRLTDPGLMQYELHDVLGQPDMVVVVEWGEIVRRVLPDDRLTITLRQAGNERRSIEIICPRQLSYLLEGVV